MSEKSQDNPETSVTKSVSKVIRWIGSILLAPFKPPEK